MNTKGFGPTRKVKWDIRLKFEDVMSDKYGRIDTLYNGLEIRRAGRIVATPEPNGLSAGLQTVRYMCCSSRYVPGRGGYRMPARQKLPVHRHRGQICPTVEIVAHRKRVKRIRCTSSSVSSKRKLTQANPPGLFVPGSKTRLAYRATPAQLAYLKRAADKLRGPYALC